MFHLNKPAPVPRPNNPDASRAWKASGIFCVGLWFMFALSASNLFAALPVDLFQDMGNGGDCDLLTPANMGASSHGAGITWSATGQLWVSTRALGDLPGPVVVDGVTYAGAPAAHSWRFNDDKQLNYVKCSLPGHYSRITVACYYSTGVTIPWVQFDSITFIEATLGTWGVLQVETETPGGPYLRCHSAAPGGKTTYSPTHIKVAAGKPYWVNLCFDGVAGTVSGAVFDPARDFAQVGATMVAPATPGAQVYGSIRFGQTSAHGNHPDATTQSYFGNILVDYTHAQFPLLPSKP
jgi:hypothetical protein